MHRSATSHSSRPVRIPVHRDELEERTRLLLSRSKSRGATRESKSGKEAATPLRETDVTFKRLREKRRVSSSGNLAMRRGFLSSNFNTEKEDNYLISKNKQNKEIPLRIFQFGRINSQPHERPSKTQRSNYPNREIKSNFLRRGTAINRSIMLNVLKSKYNPGMSQCSQSYSNQPGNNLLSAAVYEQVPRSLRDCIGPEEMLRMSNIFTGGGIPSMSLHDKVKDILVKYHRSRAQVEDEEENLTLKSIKRW